MLFVMANGRNIRKQLLIKTLLKQEEVYFVMLSISTPHYEQA